ncbi:MAG: nucleotidyl transferase AbiEii/AbiGii toxin family protein [Bacteroidales bacterium]
MLSFNEIRKEFDPGLKGINAYRSMVKEYLQAKILEFIYRGPFKDRLIFIGGTKLRLINGFRRFSDDLDFDLTSDYTNADHLALCEYLVEAFREQNIIAEIDHDKKVRELDVQTRFINFPAFLEQAGLKDTPGRKFYIKLDAQKHDFGSYTYKPDIKVLNRFDVFVPVICAPDRMILATKLCTILDRAKGRDYYDIVELVRTTKPDLDYISNRLEFGRLKMKYTGPESYLDLIKPALKNIDWQEKTREIEKFLFHPHESEKVLLFSSYATEDTIKNWLK